MRRFTLAALSASLVLSACSDQTRTPTESETTPPTADAKITAGSCANPFPYQDPGVPAEKDLGPKIAAMFLGTPHIKAANEKVAAIKKDCGKKKVKEARHKAFKFVDWTLKKYQKSQLPNANAVRLADLVSSLFVAVGLQSMDNINPSIFGPEGGAGIYDPDVNGPGGEDLRVQNHSGVSPTAAFVIPAGSLGDQEASFASLIPLPNTPPQLETDLRQSGPYFDMNIANESGNHTIGGGGESEGLQQGAPQALQISTDRAVVGFCIDQGVLTDFDNAQIGHNPFNGGFEVLDAAPTDDYARLGLSCEQANEPDGDFLRVGLNLNNGLEGLTLSAWHLASRFGRQLVERVFFPQPLQATTVVVKTGLGGLASSLSPFGVVDASGTRLELVPNWDPGDNDKSFLPNTPLEWFDPECTENCIRRRPLVRLVDASGTGVGNVEVHVTLNPLDGSTGAFTPASITTNATGEGEGSVEFDNLSITGPVPGTYTLTFSAPGATSVTSGPFTVNAGNIAGTVSSELLGPVEGAVITVSPGGQSVASHANGGYAFAELPPGPVTLKVTGVPSCFHKSGIEVVVPAGGATTTADIDLGCRRIAFELFGSPEGEIDVINADGTGQAHVTNNDLPDEYPAWSPDGSRLVFIRKLSLAFNSPGELYVMNADGTGETRLTTDEYFDFDPAWSPEGSKIAYTSLRGGSPQVRLINPDGTGQTELTPGGGATWSPDGLQIAFSTAGQIHVMNASPGSPRTQITNRAFGASEPAWSPDGTKILFTSPNIEDDGEGSSDHTVEIYSVHPDGTNQVAITDNEFFDIEPAWSPDGSKIVFTSDRDVGFTVHIMNADGTGETRLITSGATKPAW